MKRQFRVDVKIDGVWKTNGYYTTFRNALEFFCNDHVEDWRMIDCFNGDYVIADMKGEAEKRRILSKYQRTNAGVRITGKCFEARPVKYGSTWSVWYIVDDGFTERVKLAVATRMPEVEARNMAEELNDVLVAYAISD